MSKRSRDSFESLVKLPGGKVIRLIPKAQRRRYALPRPGFTFGAPANLRADAQIADAMDVEVSRSVAPSPASSYSWSAPSIARTSNTGYYRPLRRAPKKKAPAKAPKGSYFASKAMMRKRRGVTPAMAAASKASLARARLSVKKGGSRIPKRTARKAVAKVDAGINYRLLINRTKASLMKALSAKPKSVLASCLSKYYANK